MRFGLSWRLLFSWWLFPCQSFAHSAALAEGSIGEEVPQLPAEADSLIVDDVDAPESEENVQREDMVTESNPTDGKWLFTGGFGASSDFVSGQATIGFYWVRYVGVETTFFYYQIKTNQAYGTQYGPEVDLMVRAFNPTTITPFVGFGPGFTKWHRRFEGVQFSEGSSMTGNVLFGADIALTSHFGLQIMRKNINYWGEAPLSYADRAKEEPRSNWFTNIGFRTMF